MVRSPNLNSQVRGEGRSGETGQGGETALQRVQDGVSSGLYEMIK